MSDEETNYDRNTPAKNEYSRRLFSYSEKNANGDISPCGDLKNQRKLSFSDGSCISSSSSASSSPAKEMLSPEYVDNLVESFWSRMDKKIDSAISKCQQSAVSHVHGREKEDVTSPAEKRRWALVENDKYTSLPFLFIFIYEFVKKICASWKAIVKRRIERWKTSFYESELRAMLLQLVWHRYTDLVLVLLSFAILLIVTFVILQDFEAIQEDIQMSETNVNLLLYICIIILFIFVLEILAKIITLWNALFKLKMEVLDTFIVAFYFFCEAIASQGFIYIDEPYAKYFHMIAALRLWRVFLVYEEFYGTTNFLDPEEPDLENSP